MVNPQHNPLHVAISELQTALDTALKAAQNVNSFGVDELKNVDTAALNAATGAEGGVDQLLDTFETQLGDMSRQAAVLVHVEKPS